MTEPTIDEMLQWLDQLPPFRWPRPSAEMIAGIRAILEQHREPTAISITQAMTMASFIERGEAEQAQAELEAIRAFVERVEKHWPYADHNVMREELAAMEKEK